MSKPVLFVSFRPLERAENLRAIYEAYKGEKVHICTHDWNYYQEVESGKYDLMVIDEFPTVSPGKCIMIWHGIQGGKLIGLDQPKPYYREHHAGLMTYIISAGSGTREMWSRCTGVPIDRILDFGMPRTDEFKGKKKGDGKTVLAGKRAYLFVPTFRWTYDTPHPMIDWQDIDNQLTDDEILAIKRHPMDCSWVTNYKHIIELSSSEPSSKYLYDADVVITDYSSIMFDAYLLKKPVVLFEKNPGYTKTHGMYMKYPEEYCSRYATDEQELIEQIRSAKRLRTAEKRCLEIVADACDGHSCERICNLIDEMKG